MFVFVYIALFVVLDDGDMLLQTSTFMPPYNTEYSTSIIPISSLPASFSTDYTSPDLPQSTDFGIFSSEQTTPDDFYHTTDDAFTGETIEPLLYTGETVTFGDSYYTGSRDEMLESVTPYYDFSSGTADWITTEGTELVTDSVYEEAQVNCRDSEYVLAFFIIIHMYSGLDIRQAENTCLKFRESSSLDNFCW